jgi:uncharacterized protein (TIGR03083 family)
MQISPRYHAEPVVHLDGEPSAVAVPFLRQRRRFAAALTNLTPEQWAAPSRCDGWRVQDVIAHLSGTDRFWHASIAAGLGGEPSRYLVGFDPQATPAAMVDAVSTTPSSEVLASYLGATEAFCSLVESLDESGWQTVAESPLGHVDMNALVHHALWDSWVHERDVLLPLGLPPVEEHDEILASLRYVAALSPAFAMQTEPHRTGALVLALQDGPVTVTVDGGVVRVSNSHPPEGALVISGTATALLEALSVRAPLGASVAPDQAWLVDGLSRVFEAAPG